MKLRRATSIGLTLAAVLLGAGAPVSSAAADPIEQVWSFNGGEIAIHPGPSGTLVGTVVRPTLFALCSHPVGEEMWTDMRLQPDGSYWGLHHWYFETSACVSNEQRGPTAWRVMETPGGARYLLVCFSSPGGPQPMIAPHGAETQVTYGCRESARVAALPVESGPHSPAGQSRFAQAFGLPGNRKCFSRRVFQIHVKDPRYDPLQTVLVTLGRHRLHVVRHGTLFTATINLRGLPVGTFTVRIRATTVLGHHLSGSRTYHTCAVKHRVRRTAAHNHG